MKRMFILSGLVLLPLILYNLNFVNNANVFYKVYVVLTAVLLGFLTILNFTSKRLYKSKNPVTMGRIKIYNIFIFWAGILFFPTIVTYSDYFPRFFLLYMFTLSLFLITSLRLRLN
jgi:hypothetical protein